MADEVISEEVQAILDEQARIDAIYALPADEKAAACCAVTHPLTFTREGVDFVITQPENMGESIRLQITASKDGEPVSTDNEYYWCGLAEICADQSLDWVTALQEAIYSVVIR
jgi:hypothetical protein